MSIEEKMEADGRSIYVGNVSKKKSSISDQKTNLTVFAKSLLDWTKHGHWLGINQLKMCEWYVVDL